MAVFFVGVGGSLSIGDSLSESKVDDSTVFAAFLVRGGLTAAFFVGAFILEDLSVVGDGNSLSDSEVGGLGEPASFLVLPSTLLTLDANLSREPAGMAYLCSS